MNFGFGPSIALGGAAAIAQQQPYNLLYQLPLDPQIEPLLKGQNAVQNSKRFFDLRFRTRFTDDNVRPGNAATSLINFVLSPKCDPSIRLNAAQLFQWIIEKHWVCS